MTGVVKDSRALHAKHLPEHLHHRSGKIDQLSAVLKPISTGFPADDVCLFGPSGAGKTTLARYVARKLERSTLELYWGRVNCMSDSSRRGALHTLLREIGRGADLRRQGTSAGQYLDRLRSLEEPVLAIIDEVSVLQDPQLLHSLYETPDVTVIAITIDEDRWFQDLDPRVSSRFRGAEKITLDAYNRDELRDIIEDRARRGLEPDVWTQDAVTTIAKRSDGDARFGIALLRRAARQVRSGDADTITPLVIDDVATEAETAIRRRYVSKLGTHQRLLFEIIEDAEEITATELHQEYEHRIDDPRSRSMRRRYLKSLREYNLVESGGSGKGKWYRSKLLQS